MCIYIFQIFDVVASVFQIFGVSIINVVYFQVQ